MQQPSGSARGMASQAPQRHAVGSVVEAQWPFGASANKRPNWPVAPLKAAERRWYRAKILSVKGRGAAVEYELEYHDEPPGTADRIGANHVRPHQPHKQGRSNGSPRTPAIKRKQATAAPAETRRPPSKRPKRSSTAASATAAATAGAATAGTRALDNEAIAGLAFVHTPPGRKTPTLGSVQFVLPATFPRTANAKAVVMYTDTDDTLENTIIDSRARTANPVEIPLTFKELDKLLSHPTQTVQQLQRYVYVRRAAAPHL